MIVVYGKGRVGNSIMKLIERFPDVFGNNNFLMDDIDYDDSILSKADNIVISPGIPPSNNVYSLYKEKIIGELDFLYDFLNKKSILDNFQFVGVTGTDGKSTVSYLLYMMFDGMLKNKTNIGYENVWLGGNYDPPLAEILETIYVEGLEGKKHLIILEISSFMGYNIHNFEFNHSIWTNFTKDHLNRHKDMQEYFDSKFNILRKTKYSKIVHYSLLDSFRSKGIDESGFFSYDDMQNIENKNLRGKHNFANLNGVFILGMEYFKDKNIYNIEFELKNILSNLNGLPHRIQLVKEINGIMIYDDGKSTTAQSLKAAINSFDEKIVLIAGGSDKGDDFSVLEKDFYERISYGVFLGSTKDKFVEVANNAGISSDIAIDMDNAVNLAYKFSYENNIKVILFSPGCASFDMFKNRLDRVDKFLLAIERLV